MKRLRALALVGIVACGGTDESSTSGALHGRRSYLVLATSEDSLPPNIAVRVAKLGGKVTASVPEIGLLVVEADDGFSSNARKLAGIRSIVRNQRRSFLPPRELEGGMLAAFPAAPRPPGSSGGPPAAPTLPPSDEAYPLEWGLQAVGAPAAWQKGYFGQGVRVAVLDTGITPYHPDIYPNLDMDDSVSFVPGEAVFQDSFQGYSYHGLHVAGTIAAAMNNGYAVGVAPQAQLVAVKVLGNDGYGDDSWIIQGLVHAADVHADIANLSLLGYLPRGGGCYTDGECVTASEANEQIVAFKRAITYARRKGTTVIVAAGNDALDMPHATTAPGIASGTNIMLVPGGLEDVITVSATGPYGWGVNPHTADLFRPAHYSNRGSALVDLGGPGGDSEYPQDRWCLAHATSFAFYVPCWVLDMVVSTYDYSYGGVAWARGTSMATPHVSGLAALILSERGKLSPTQLEAQLRARALDLGKRGNDDDYGQGFAHFGSCTPASSCSDDRGVALCGALADGCGGSFDCSGCSTGETCNPDTSTCCQPRTCAQAPGACGEIDDFCGGTIDCGGCPEGEVCFESSCCTPKSCQEGVTCGPQSDLCGGTIECGGCFDGQACSPGAGTCCTPETCADYGANCGDAVDHCTGAIFFCGTCPVGQECGDGGKCCTAKTCEELGACGWVWDGCATFVDCGGCPDGEVCTWNHTCCAPSTCSGLGAQCGGAWDGCSSYIFCGGCPTGQECRWDNTCCTPMTCAELGVQCGYAQDGCGLYADCGVCPTGQECRWDNTCCTPMTCAQLGKECGYVGDDGCGMGTYCGGCPTGEECRWDNTCCTPMTCAELGKQCGYVGDDGCGLSTYCGDCPAGQECRWDANTCCTPLTCAQLGKECGYVGDDGCGLSTDCGGCTGSDVCVGNTCGPPPPNRLDCICADGTQLEFCDSSIDCNSGPATDRACSLSCTDHGGVTGLACQPDRICERPDAPPPLPPQSPPPGPGADLVQCTCADSTTVAECVTVDCAASATLATMCADVCAEHFGSTGSSCAAEDARCTLGVGTGADLARCWCADGSGASAGQLDFCAALDGCNTGLEADALCAAACELNGWTLRGIGCAADAWDTVCAAP